MSYQPSKQEILRQVENIIKNNILGRSENLNKLLLYLVEREINRIERGSDEAASPVAPPKEIELALDVFGKTAEFNMAEDASVRVHISRLRKKLDDYYSTQGKDQPFSITLPVGEYRLIFKQLTQDKPANKAKKFKWNLAVVLLCVLTLVAHFFLGNFLKPVEVAKQADPIWQRFIEHPRNSIIVLGQTHSQAQSQVQGVSKGLVLALKNILSLTDNFRFTHVLLASELTPNHIKQNNVIYIGDLANLGLLGRYFNGSQFSYSAQDNLLSSKVLDKILPAPQMDNVQYTDYGVFAKFDGPNNNKVYLITGYTDASLLWLSWYITSLQQHNIQLSKIGGQLNERLLANKGENFEWLFKIPSMDGTDISSELLTHSRINHNAVW